jgi:hypothetical protein
LNFIGLREFRLASIRNYANSNAQFGIAEA